MSSDDKNPIPADDLKDQAPPPGMHKVTDMDTGEVFFERDKTPQELQEESDIMDFADGSDGGANTDGGGA